MFYTLSGKGSVGTDYTVNGLMGQVVIPAGQSFADIVVTTFSDTSKERSEKVTIKLSPGQGYTLPKGKSAKKAKLIIQNIGGT